MPWLQEVPLLLNSVQRGIITAVFVPGVSQYTSISALLTTPVPQEGFAPNGAHPPPLRVKSASRLHPPDMDASRWMMPLPFGPLIVKFPMQASAYAADTVLTTIKSVTTIRANASLMQSSQTLYGDSWRCVLPSVFSVHRWRYRKT